jgi:hypothetical protein
MVDALFINDGTIISKVNAKRYKDAGYNLFSSFARFSNDSEDASNEAKEIADLFCADHEEMIITCGLDLEVSLKESSYIHGMYVIAGGPHLIHTFYPPMNDDGTRVPILFGFYVPELDRKALFDVWIYMNTHIDISYPDYMTEEEATTIWNSQ